MCPPNQEIQKCLKLTIEFGRATFNAFLPVFVTVYKVVFFVDCPVLSTITNDTLRVTRPSNVHFILDDALLWRQVHVDVVACPNVKDKETQRFLDGPPRVIVLEVVRSVEVKKIP
jgi:hypothetical protein